MTHVAFVVPFVFETSVRFLRATVGLPGVRVSLVSRDPLERFPADIVSQLVGHAPVADPLDAAHLARATRELAERHGPVARLMGVLEELQVPLALARAELGLPGIQPETAVLVRDKDKMKERFRAAGVPCAASARCTGTEQVLAFVKQHGLPVVCKPPAGAGGRNTFRADDGEQLRKALQAAPPSPASPVLVEQFLTGQEHSFDSVCIDGRTVWSSISSYEPTPLEVLETPWIQWAVLLPRDVSGPEFDPIREVGPRAVAALGVETALCHMEWFRRPDGTVAVSEVGARPPGAQFTSLMSWAHDTDMYAAWAGLMVYGAWPAPERRYAVGAAYFRGQGRGQVVSIHGLDQAQRELGELVVETRLPRKGQAPATSYEGEGYAILRHPETEVVRDGLRRLVSLVRVELG